MTGQTPRSHKPAILAVSCATFFGLGLFTSSLGPNLPELSRITASSLATLGTIFTAMYLGSGLSQLAAGPLNDRLGQRPGLLMGLALCALGVVGIATSHSLAFTVASGLLAGVGAGAMIISANVLVAEVFASRSVPALNVLNIFFGVGAITGPAIAGLLLKTIGTGVPMLWVAAVVFLFVVPFVARLAIPRGVAHAAGAPAVNSRAVYRTPLLWALGALLLMYVGTELGMNGWTTTYLDRSTTMGPDTAALVTAGFWLALTSGRVTAALLGAKLSSTALLLMSVGGALLGGLLLATSTGNAPLSVLATVLIGLCFGPIFPTAIAITTASFRGAPGKAVSAAAAMGSVGGMVLPWLQGVVIEGSGPRASAVQVAICTGLLVGLALLVKQLSSGRNRRIAGENEAAVDELDVA
jgi:fucose permease